MPFPPGYSGPAVTFQQIFDALNGGPGTSKPRPGNRPTAGDNFITWVQDHAHKLGYQGSVDLAASAFGPYTATQWFQGYFAYAVGHGLAGAISAGVGVFGKIPGIIKDVGTGIYKTPGAKKGARDLTGLENAFNRAKSDITGAFSFNYQSLLVRAGEIIAGAVLLAIGVNAMFPKSPLAIVSKAAGAAGKLVP
jgi:hypothetical protein